jgi:hypothetical protein
MNSTTKSLFPLKPTHKPVLAYYAALAQFHQDGHKTEGNTRSAFAVGESLSDTGVLVIDQTWLQQPRCRMLNNG